MIKELAKALSGKAAGFYTGEIRKGGVRTGFSITTLGGKTGTLASIDTESPYRVGKYKVDLEDFEKVALPAVEQALADSKTIIIDEIGPMELYSQRFKKIVLEALDSPNRVIATIKLRSSSFIDTIKSRKDVAIYTLDYNNRKEILQEALSNLTK